MQYYRFARTGSAGSILSQVTGAWQAKRTPATAASFQSSNAPRRLWDESMFTVSKVLTGRPWTDSERVHSAGGRHQAPAWASFRDSVPLLLEGSQSPLKATNAKGSAEALFPGVKTPAGALAGLPDLVSPDLQSCSHLEDFPPQPEGPQKEPSVWQFKTSLVLG